MAVAQFPDQVWDGLSDNWQRKLLTDYEAPNPDDWNQIVAEMIATQSQLVVVAGVNLNNTSAASISTLETSGNTTIGGTLAVTGTSTLTGNVACSGTLIVTGASTLGGNVTCSNAVSVGSSLAVGTTSTFTGIATFSNDIKIASGHVLKVNNIQVVSAQQSNITQITTTYTAGSAPTPGSTQTIANSATPTVVELLQYIANVEAKLYALLTAIKAHGLVASS